MSTGSRFTAGELDRAAIDAAIARHPFNPHEKSADAVRRTVLALMYKEGYRQCEKHTEAQVMELVDALEKICSLRAVGLPAQTASEARRLAREALPKFRGDVE